jgi:hypothetical protein
MSSGDPVEGTSRRHAPGTTDASGECTTFGWWVRQAEVSGVAIETARKEPGGLAGVATRPRAGFARGKPSETVGEPS